MSVSLRGLDLRGENVCGMKRTVAFSTLWTASAAAAVGLGFLAVSFVDADASPVTRPIAATESVTAAPSPSPSDSGSDSGGAATPTPTSPPPVAAPASGEYATVGGTVFASCDGGVLQVAAAPAAGWWVDDQAQHGEVEFESSARKVEVHVACADGAPAFRDEGVRADRDQPEDSGSSSSASPSPSPASPSTGADDSAGPAGGGHGSDDPPGDDSAGRGDDSGPDD